MDGDQEGRVGRADRARRDDHAPPRGRPGASAVVRPPASTPLAAVLRAVKRVLDPSTVMNPGVLVQVWKPRPSVCFCARRFVFSDAEGHADVVTTELPLARVTTPIRSE